MNSPRSLLPLTVLAALALAGCSQSQGHQIVDSSAGGAYPARLPLSGIALPVESAPAQPKGGTWQLADERADFGLPGQPALLSVSCRHEANGAASLVITRQTRAADNAKALLALIGNGRIARIGLDVTRPGEAGEWQGAMPASDTRLDVLRGGNSMEATLPGGGTLKLPASSGPGRVLAACRARDRSPAQPA